MENNANTRQLANELYQSISELVIIDAHEHLPPEANRLAYEIDAVTLFENYPRFELFTAGITDAQYAMMIDRDIPLDERWSILREFLPLIRQTSSARTTYLSVRELYGFDDINDSNYLDLTKAMKAANKPGIYRRVFRDYCRAAAVLNQCFFRIHPPSDNFLRPQVWEHDLNVGCAPHHHLHPFELIERDLKRWVSSLSAYKAALADLLQLFRSKGVLGIKLLFPTIQSQPPDDEVEPLFDRIVDSRSTGKADHFPLNAAEQTALTDNVAHEIIRIAGDVGMTAIQHSGYCGTWGDWRVTNPTNLIPVFAQYPQVNFEIYHAGHPWVRETGMVAKACPNVWLNLCWSHSLSGRMTRSGLDEWLDLVAVNKIIAYGGDTHLWVEWSVGDLVQARENVASVLARRINDGLLKEEQAMDLARLMFYENPADLYNLGRPGLDDFCYE